MEKRKNPEKDLRSKSGLFFQIGLLSAMFLTVCAFEFKSKEISKPVDLSNIYVEEETIVPITEIKPPPPPPPKPVVYNPEVLEPDELEVEVPDVVFDTEEIPDAVIEEIEDLPEEIVPKLPFDIVEDMPEPEGGYEAFYKFINKNLKYPSQARRVGIGGTVYLKFVVDENGEMVDITIAKGVGAGCDKEVLRIFKNPPKWIPGKQRGVPVKVNQIIPVKFILN
ncbi:energy transducer TonB [Fulvivirga sp. M361]|uniref:energy transducer TonB n=1 Tax=Fulvivirga sp. M361 TaxID=2594266 RepID=UPI00117B0C47|nr:energy transducer TonB [Fulvivirga sp. M361]TRX49339.1 energy transducer TonB [Fulvivirga sp. M361]